MTTDTITLRWGHNAIPSNATAAWGARAIMKGYEPLDLLGDRQDAQGPDVDTLLARLNDGLLRDIKATIDELRFSYFTYWDSLFLSRETEYHPVIQPDQANDVVVYQDDEYTAVANSNKSFGYCYVVVFYTPKEA